MTSATDALEARDGTAEIVVSVDWLLFVEDIEGVDLDVCTVAVLKKVEPVVISDNRDQGGDA